ncbi:MAG: cobyrinate a,c-diamide synthase [Novosphingobium sp.]|uniref:cobyrinate a,c-diamide synthase n=1 Tax=Novosphingobium sp. TaxID=1874826 RepID=UPI0012CA940D|nr:cobyrinate a,c-diamide synthase [Novosphingobium sp.]MPS69442.1 cobyrinate a,c-diamide synthase [Novosphingobium sp.]
MTACPALLVAAPSSGQGKTLVTAALARRHVRAGRRVRVFKCGPDFLDPMVHEIASGAPVHQLDLFMCGEDQCRALLHEAALETDLILVEGVMGLFDGTPSSADLARHFGLPVMAVMDGSSMAQTFGALVHGLATYRDDVTLAAVLANRVGSERHAELLERGLREGVQWLGAMRRDEGAGLPERHLGLVQAGEVPDIEARIDRAADLLPESALWLPEPVSFPAAPRCAAPPPSLAGRRIAVARDEAFGFIYPANLAFLESAGARLSFFSPLRDTALPECDALWLPGGYPELHLCALTANRTMIGAIREHFLAKRPILAECGGMLYACERLEDASGTSAPMLGLLPAQARMQPRLAALGMQEAELGGHAVRGHTFHYSMLETGLEPAALARTPDGRKGERIFRQGSLTASYMHFYFPSAPELIAALFG